MSGRAVNVAKWAPGPNYPAGGNTWNSTPVRVANTGRLFTPGTVESPQEINAEFGEITDTLINVIEYGNHPAKVWPYCDIYPSGSSLLMDGAAYDSKWGRWTLFGHSTALNVNCAWTSSDGGRTWAPQGGQTQSTGTVSSRLQGLIYAPAGSGIDGLCAVATYNGAATGGTDLTAVTDETVRLSLTLSGGVPLAGIWFNGLFIFSGRDGSNYLLKTSSGGAWTSRTTTQSGWGNATVGYFLAANSVGVMAATGGVAHNETAYSTDGTTWTVRTTGITLGASEFKVGLAWAGDRWAMGITDGTSSRIVTSTDNGVTWTTSATLTNYVLGGLGSCGALLFATCYVHGSIRGIYSGDGGVTWNAGSQYYATPQTANHPDYVCSSGAGFLTVNSAHLSISSFL